MDNPMSNAVKTFAENFFHGDYFNVTTFIVTFLIITAISVVVNYFMIRDEPRSELKNKSFWWYFENLLVGIFVITILLFIAFSLISAILIYCWYLLVVVAALALAALLLREGIKYYKEKNNF